MHNFVTIAKEEKFNSYLSFVNRVFAIYIKYMLVYEANKKKIK